MRTRLERLEESGRALRAGVLEQIVMEALQAVSDEDLATLRDMNSRGVGFEDCTPEQTAFLGRFGAECEVAAMTLFGRRLADLNIKQRLAELARTTDARSSRPAVPTMPWRQRSRRSMRGRQ
jgi:hypothetical protein